MPIKLKIYNQFLDNLNTKIVALEMVLADLKRSGTNETKSTAGDKHETALAMLQIEQANVRKQLSEALLQKSVMLKINPALSSIQIVNGSLVRTSKGCFFIAIAGGRIKHHNLDVTAISVESPLGKKLLGLKAGGNAEINGNIFTVEKFE